MSTEVRPPGRVLVRLPTWIGDIVMATPALRAIKAHWPDAELVAAGPPTAPALLEGLAFVDEVVVLPRRAQGGVAGLLRSARRLRARAFDVAILLPNSISSALVAVAARIPVRVGYAHGGRGLLLTHALAHPREAGRHRMPVPMPDYYGRLIESIGIPRGSHRTELVVLERDERAAQAWLERQGLLGARLVGLHAGSSFGPSKLWSAERFAAVADALHAADGSRAIAFCGPGEEHLAREIQRRASSPVATAADDPLPLTTLKAVVKRLALLVTTDTGPRHFAAPFDVPSVVLMGSTDPRFTNTNLHASLVVRTGVACSPCHLKVCPIDHRCMTRLTPQMVLAAAERVLKRAS